LAFSDEARIEHGRTCLLMYPCHCPLSLAPTSPYTHRLSGCYKLLTMHHHQEPSLQSAGCNHLLMSQSLTNTALQLQQQIITACNQSAMQHTMPPVIRINSPMCVLLCVLYVCGLLSLTMFLMRMFHCCVVGTAWLNSSLQQ
jgi:hypothetical protein